MARTRSEHAHDAATYDSDKSDARALARNVLKDRFNRYRGQLSNSRRLDSSNLNNLEILPVAFANVRKSTAAGAITAVHLHALVQALRKRHKPVRPVCHFISSGNPRRFTWDEAKGRFIARAKGGNSDLTLTLLGPSDKLVEKHQEKLPILAYKMAFFTARLDLEGITESNQLSYILTLEKAGQRLPISGDAGCYDFKKNKSRYFQLLLEALKPLHVVQVAHHAGRNYDFYNTLLEGGFAEQKDHAYLLLSHEVHDKTRPSSKFREFIEQIRKPEDEVSLLFTSEPDAAKVKDYEELIYKVIPPGNIGIRGDVRLSYIRNEEGLKWAVEKHSVAVK